MLGPPATEAVDVTKTIFGEVTVSIEVSVATTGLSERDEADSSEPSVVRVSLTDGAQRGRWELLVTSVSIPSH